MKPSRSKILIVDDDELFAEYLKTTLEGLEFGEIHICLDGNTVPALMEEAEFDLVLLDLRLPGVSGTDLLERLHESKPDIPLIVITAEDTVSAAVDCMKAGAFDFLTKPIQESRLVPLLRHALRIRELQMEIDELKTVRPAWNLKNPEEFGGILTASDIMYNVFVNIEAVAASPRAVLITGESGTGKELIARAVHRVSKRSGRFVAVNVSGLDDTMFSDTLFGHNKGAFTGAETGRKGLVEQAADGTLFLDEIGDLEMSSQIKLLRLLQEGEFYPLGSDKPSFSRTRVVAATNADLKAKQAHGTFRTDLYYRLMTHHLEIPPLRERQEDLPLLAGHFIKEAAKSLGRNVPGVPKELLRILTGYRFPGNVRELQAILYNAVGRSGEKTLNTAILKDYVKKHVSPQTGPWNSSGALDSDASRFPTLKEIEDRHIRLALDRVKGNQSLAAGLLGVSQSTLSRWLKSRSRG